MTFYGKWFWMVRGGYWSLKSLSFIQFDLWNLNLKISLLAWDWCAISSEMRNRKKTKFKHRYQVSKIFVEKGLSLAFLKKNRPFSVMSEKSNTFAFELSWASQSKLTNSPLTTSRNQGTRVPRRSKSLEKEVFLRMSLIRGHPPFWVFRQVFWLHRIWYSFLQVKLLLSTKHFYRL